MWIFEATYENMDLDNSIKSVKRRIKFDGDNFFNTGEECYRYALEHIENETKKWMFGLFGIYSMLEEKVKNEEK